MVNQNRARKSVPPLGEPLKVRGRLYQLGWPSIAEWARAHGHGESTAKAVVQRWSERDIEPLGGISRQVMRDLRTTLDKGIGPDVAKVA